MEKYSKTGTNNLSQPYHKAEGNSIFFLPFMRSNYGLLVAELKKRFTPVQLRAVQTQHFHDRQQGPKETVDEYTQELKMLFAKAYAGISRGLPEAETMGQTVLTNQFVSGLQPELAGVEGNLEQLLLKARFEEAKKRELASVKTVPYAMKAVGGSSLSPAAKSYHPKSGQTNPGGTKDKPA